MPPNRGPKLPCTSQDLKRRKSLSVKLDQTEPAVVAAAAPVAVAPTATTTASTTAAASATATAEPQEQTLHDFVLTLLTDAGARTEFISDPTGCLAGAGLGDITAVNVQDVVPLVIDSASGLLDLNLSLDGASASAITQLTAVATAATGIASEGGLSIDGTVTSVHGLAGGLSASVAGLSGVSTTGTLDSVLGAGKGELALGLDGIAGQAAAHTGIVSVDSTAASSLQGGLKGGLDAGTDAFSVNSGVGARFDGISTAFNSTSGLGGFGLGTTANTDGIVGVAGVESGIVSFNSGVAASTTSGIETAVSTQSGLGALTVGTAASTEGASVALSSDQVSVGGDLAVSTTSGVSGGLSTDSALLGAFGGSLSASTDGVTAGFSSLSAFGGAGGLNISTDGVAGGIDLGLVQIDIAGGTGGVDFATGGAVELSSDNLAVPELTAPLLGGLDLPIDTSDLLGALPVDTSDLLDTDLLRGGDITATATVASYVADGGSLLAAQVETLGASTANLGLGGILTGATAELSVTVESTSVTVSEQIADLPAAPSLPALPVELPALPSLPTDLLPTDGSLPVDLPIDLPFDLPHLPGLPSLPNLPVANPLPDLGSLPGVDGLGDLASPVGGVIDTVDQHLPELGGLTDGLHFGG
jgi:hypothetical protein